MWPFKKKNKLKQCDKNMDYKDLFSRIQRNSIQMIFIKDASIAMGKSKFGGEPHLPKIYQWPYYTGDIQDGTDRSNVMSRPLMFIMQINCCDIIEYDIEKELPHTGILYFFYEMQTQKWGFDPEDRGSAVVYYYDGDYSELSNTTWPEDLPEEFKLPEHSIVFNHEYDIPSYEEYCNNDQIDTDCWDVYDENKQLYGYTSEDEYNNKILGYADLIQGDMLAECQLASNGIYCGDTEGYDSEKAKILITNRQDWVLLAQISSIMSENFELMFGDCGSIYFYIKKEDLKSNNFNRIWLILQCG